MRRDAAFDFRPFSAAAGRFGGLSELAHEYLQWAICSGLAQRAARSHERAHGLPAVDLSRALPARRRAGYWPRAGAPMASMITAWSEWVVLLFARLAAPSAVLLLCSPLMPRPDYTLSTLGRAFRRRGRAGARVLVLQPCAFVCARSVCGRAPARPAAQGERRAERTRRRRGARPRRAHMTGPSGWPR